MRTPTAGLAIAAVHYHLQRGGVTRVLENTATALINSGLDCDFGIIHGPPLAAIANARTLLVPELAYSTRSDAIDGDTLYQKLLAAARELFGRLPDIWHIHNHSLGKHTGMAGAVRRLAGDGHRVLLQIHDFAEDGRPENYRLAREFWESPEDLYPCASQIHYATLNQRDLGILRSAGVPASHAHHLGNPVSAPQGNPAETPSHHELPHALANRPYLLYPVRALRRKNLGECLLLSYLTGTAIATTLGPTNEAYRPQFNKWKALAHRLKLPVHFGIAEREPCDFSTLVAQSTAILTTSIAEGFGLTFIEPWLMDKCVVGRDLPEITRDFAATDLNLEHLYDTLPIPLEDIPALPSLRQRLESGLRHTFAAYETPLPPRAAEEAWQALTHGGQIDFGHMDEIQQEAILLKCASGEGSFSDNFTPRVLATDEALRHRKDNAQAATRAFDSDTFLNVLLGIYEALLQAPIDRMLGHIPPQRVLARFLNPQRFHLLRT